MVEIRCTGLDDSVVRYCYIGLGVPEAAGRCILLGPEVADCSRSQRLHPGKLWEDHEAEIQVAQSESRDVLVAGKSPVDQSTVPLVFALQRSLLNAFVAKSRHRQYPQRHIGPRYQIRVVD